MTEFHAELRARIAAALASLQEAHDAGDDHLAEIREGELESLARLAREHDLVVAELDAYDPSRALAG